MMMPAQDDVILNYRPPAELLNLEQLEAEHVGFSLFAFC
jgi:hypothetical protein